MSWRLMPFGGADSAAVFAIHVENKLQEHGKARYEARALMRAARRGAKLCPRLPPVIVVAGVGEFFWRSSRK